VSELVDALIRESSYSAWKPTLDAKDEEIKTLKKVMWAQQDRNVELRREIAFLERALEQATEKHTFDFMSDRISLTLGIPYSQPPTHEIGIWWTEELKPDLVQWFQRTKSKWIAPEYKEKSL
jgi:hypothetical protein